MSVYSVFRFLIQFYDLEYILRGTMNIVLGHGKSMSGRCWKGLGELGGFVAGMCLPEPPGGEIGCRTRPFSLTLRGKAAIGGFGRAELPQEFRGMWRGRKPPTMPGVLVGWGVEMNIFSYIFSAPHVANPVFRIDVWSWSPSVFCSPIQKIRGTPRYKIPVSIQDAGSCMKSPRSWVQDAGRATVVGLAQHGVGSFHACWP